MRLGFVIALVALAAGAEAQTVTGARFTLTTGPCTLRSGSGAPGSSLGVVCDLYVRTDSPYGTYRKTGASTWTLLVPEPGTTGITTVGALGTGSITSGFGAIDVGADGITGGAFSGTTGAFSTSVTSPLFTHSGAASVTTASGNLTLAPAGDVVFNPTGNDLLPTTGYDLNIGALTNKFLTLHAAELWVETLVAQNTMATIGGRILVGPTTTLTSDLASGATSMSVKHNEIVSGDRVVLQANGQVEWIAVTSGSSGSGPYTYSIARNQDGSGANDWTAGDAVFNTGTTGDGFIDLYSVAGVIPGSTAGPTIVGHERLSGTYSDIEARWAIGNLNGLYGYGATTYGTAFGDPSATNITLDATNGFRIRNGTTDKLVADTSGNLSLSGDLSVGTVGTFRSGTTTYGSGTGYVLDYSGSAYRFRVGTTGGNRIAWDGTDLTIVSNNFTVDASGVSLTPPTSFSGTSAYAWTVPTGFLRTVALDSGTDRVIQATAAWSGAGSKSTSVALNAAANSGTSGSLFSVNSSGSGESITFAMPTATAGMFPTYWQFDNDLQIRTDNSSSTGMPYIRGNGSYLAIESRSNANSGFLTLNGDQAADVYLTQGGGTTRIYTALVLNGLTSCTLQVNGSGAVGCVSDAAAKRDIQSWRSGLDTVNRLRPVSYQWADGGDTGRHIGFIAQDVDRVIPEAVSRQEWGGGLLTLDDRAILAALVNAVQELSKKVKK